MNLAGQAGRALGKSLFCSEYFLYLFDATRSSRASALGSGTKVILSRCDLLFAGFGLLLHVGHTCTVMQHCFRLSIWTPAIRAVLWVCLLHMIPGLS